MFRTSVLILGAITAIVSSVACSGGEIAVGKSNQQLQTKTNGDPTGNGTTCSWDGTALYATASSSAGSSSAGEPTRAAGGGTVHTGGGQSGNTGSADDPSTPSTGGGTPSGGGSYSVGSAFPSLDGCNECECTGKGIMCTVKACTPNTDAGAPVACETIAMKCPDGSYVAPTGPNCEIPACPGAGTACPDLAKQCPDGSSVSATGPNCEYPACPGGDSPVACPQDAKQCPDGSYVSRTGPACTFPACP